MKRTVKTIQWLKPIELSTRNKRLDSLVVEKTFSVRLLELLDSIKVFRTDAM
jgi:hypothetical protein